ncbi:MAG: mechanosensitive ion channel family protein [Candidatus Brocadiaceae bacterium]|nr:mechanosensitive ion channel family protein [Candidatus Brocadiaceae bacterium]
MKNRNLLLSVCIALVLFNVIFNSLVCGNESVYVSSTTAFPEVPVEDLELLLKPLTKGELEVEAKAWLGLLKEKVNEVSLAEIQARRKNKEIKKAKNDTEGTIAPVSEAQIEQKTKTKGLILSNITRLQEERSALINRFSAAVDALEAKGGDIDEYRKYVNVTSGITVDIQDVSAAKTVVLGWLMSSEGGLLLAKNFGFFVVTLLGFYILSRLLSKITKKAVSVSEKTSDLLQQFFVSTVRKTTMLIGIVIALSMLGVNIGPLVAGIGAIGFIIGFALQGTLGNFAAGLMILMYRPYDVGNIIETSGKKGIVDSMNLVSTTIKTFDNQIIIVPNGTIWGDVITNVTGSDTRRVDMMFGISYTDDINKAQKILEDIVKAHKFVLDSPTPIIRLHELGDSSVNFVCRPWANTDHYWDVYWDITRSVKELFDKKGISIPFPQRDVHVYHETEAKEATSL